MAAYVIVDIEVLDTERYEHYKELAAPTVAGASGEYLVRGGEVRCLEGSWMPSRLVVLQFESVQKAMEWWDSEEYAPAKALRRETASTQMIVVAGT